MKEIGIAYDYSWLHRVVVQGFVARVPVISFEVTVILGGVSAIRIIGYRTFCRLQPRDRELSA